MKDGKPFVARPESHKALLLGYLRFPEIVEVFYNITKDKSLSSQVLSDWDKETLEGHISQFIVPLLLEAEVIKKDQSRKSGFSTEYDDLQFSGLTSQQHAQICAKRADLIGRSIENHDTGKEFLCANLFFESLPDELQQEMFGTLRAFLKRFLGTSIGASTNGKRFRLALVARSEENGGG